tara:strand:- start:2792 stop:5722 length:2931 start_codon:yes stop_codon:yes gene_type:complete
MSVKSFKFVSPGVFINEIDNSFIPKSADAIGPVVVGRAGRGLAMQPLRVESYSDFVEIYGDTVPGNAGGDVYRRGNFQTPMYGTYAAKAFLRANVAPVTYIRLMGCQHTNATTAGQAGWATAKDPAGSLKDNGGAYGLWVFASGTSVQLGTGSLAAIWYLDISSSVHLSGTMRGAAGISPGLTGSDQGTCKVIGSDANGIFTVVITGAAGTSEKISFNFNDDSEYFIRKRFNTNPQLGNNNASNFYPTSSAKKYWLGETFEQELRDGLNSGLTGGGTDVSSAELQGVILPIASGSTSVSDGPNKMKGISYHEAAAGWFIGQDLAAAATFTPENAQKLFRLVGRGHAEWLHKNAKVSIENIRASTTTLSEYGTFSVVIRMLHDTDSNVQVLERFDNVTLDPTSPNFVARRIGDTFFTWSDTDRRLRGYGEYPPVSKYVRVDMNEDVEAGATDPLLVPFGYYGPPKFSDVLAWGGGRTQGAASSGSAGSARNSYIYIGAAVEGGPGTARHTTDIMLSSSAGACSGSLLFPSVRLRHSSSDGGLPDQTDAYFGMQTTRTQTSTRSDMSVADPNRLWLTSIDDPTSTAVAGVDSFAYIFSMDDVVYDTTKAGYYYSSGSRKSGTSYTATSTNTYKTLIDADINRFTAPFWGGYDALDITKPDPFYNVGIGTDETTSYTYNTLKRALDTVADPEYIDMNLLSMPGITNATLTTHMVNLCEERADAMAVIDLPDVYVPAHEERLTRVQRRRATVSSATSALRERRIDSSYGCTFYPWVQTRDETTGQLVWIPPSVAMMGVLASSQAASDLWFAPAGFNRGGLSDGAAGIPVVNVTERLASKDRDTLYENRINPIASFPSTGIVVFGQRTLQERGTALDRINVRRLVIYLKKQISVLSTQVLFEQNVQATWNRFKALIEPFLANVKVQFGITDYRLILDDTTTTSDLIDQNIMYAKIMIKPARAIEYIAIDFVIANTGASFDD